MSERDYARAETTHDVAVDRDVDLGPGRLARSASLDTPKHPVVSRLIQRKAERDDNGVALGADAAVAAASSSSGMSLPAPLLRKFESSLGADLSSVRVHTGSASAEAAQAVSAKAYTVGQDIHFGAGHYDPSSTAGQHLLAHEVAHTVQQSGGAQRKMQFKLEVSTPGDAHENEADHAADAMVLGQPFEATASAGLSRRVAREVVADGMWNKAQDAEDKLHKNGVTSVEGSVSNVKSLDQAAAAKATIAGQAAMLNSTSHNMASNGQYVPINNDAIKLLDSYLHDASQQSSSISQYQAMFDRQAIDYTRLTTQMSYLAGATGGDLASNTGGAAGMAALLVKQASGGETVGGMQKDFNDQINDKATNAVGIAGSRLAVSDQIKGFMEIAAGSLSSAQYEYVAAEGAARGAAQNLVMVVQSQKKAGVEGQIAGLIAAATTARDQVMAIGSIVKSLVSMGTAGTAAAFGGANNEEGFPDPAKVIATVGTPGAALVGTVVDLATFVAAHQFDDKIANLRKQSSALSSEIDVAQVDAAVGALDATKARLLATGSKYGSVAKELKIWQNTYRFAMQQTGKLLDRKQSGSKFAAVAQLLADADAYVAQAGATIAAGTYEKDIVASNAAGSKGKVDSAENGNGTVWWSIKLISETRAGGQVYREHELTRNYLKLTLPSNLNGEPGHDPREYADGPQGANATMEKSLATLKTRRDGIKTIADHLRTIFTVK
jgi:hypothetical protein